MTNINEYNYLWETEKENWVLVNTSFGYGIIDKKNHMMLMIEDEDLEKALIDRMLREGNNVYEDITDAYADN